MKKFLSAVLVLSLIFIGLGAPSATAAGNAAIESEKFSFVQGGEFGISEIREDIKNLNDGKLTKAELTEKYGPQLRELDVMISGIKDMNDIYGIQFSVKVDTENVALAYLETNLQNSSKIGVSRWEAYMSHKDTKFKSALVLMYGTRAVTAEPNDVVNKVSSGKYKIAKLYYIVDNNFAEDFKITYSVEDIASKDDNGTVKSIVAEFKETSECVAKFAEELEELNLKTLGAQVRVSGKQGIRFGSRLQKDDYFEKCTDVSYGTLIAVTNQLGKKELTLDAECDFLDSTANVIEETDSQIVFSGEITNFPGNGDYDTVNFTARAYVKYKAPKDDEYTVSYAEPVVRSVSQIKSLVGMK